MVHLLEAPTKTLLSYLRLLASMQAAAAATAAAAAAAAAARKPEGRQSFIFAACYCLLASLQHFN
jgi:predicted membrane-bound mannosyltransferase